MKISSRVNIPKGMWKICPECKNIIFKKELEENYYVCPKCNHHNRVSAEERLKEILDIDSFNEMFTDVDTKNILDFDGYEEKLERARKKTLLKEAVVVGCGDICKNRVAIGVMDSNFMMGSMGAAVGEKITRLVEFAQRESLPLILFTASGGARMQEGIVSLMQMAKISSSISRYKENGGLYLTILTDPTTGGVTASFAMEGDIIISEPKALIGFAGKKVVNNTINEDLSNNVQTAEMNLKNGFIDAIVDRKSIKGYLANILEVRKGVHYGM